MHHGQIVETGRYLPDHIVLNSDLENIVDTSDEWIYSRTGIKERRIAVDETVAEMAIKAVNQIIKKRSLDPLTIDLIVTATVTSEYSTPSTSCIIQGAIGADHAFCFDLQAGCSGFVYGLDVVDQFIRTGKVKKALVLGVEKLSQIVNWEDRSTCVLFGDGAGAVLVEATESQDEGILVVQSKSIGESWDKLYSPIRHNDTPFYKQSLEPFIKMDGREVFTFTCTKVPQLIDELMVEVNIKKEKIDVFVLHQANKRIIERIAKQMKVPIEKFYMNMERFGNMSSATIPIALDELNERGNLIGKTIAISGFGAGLTYSAAIIKF